MAELTDERIYELAIECGIGHTVIAAKYANAVGIELGTRCTVSDVRPEHTLAFARAIAAEVADQALEQENAALRKDAEQLEAYVRELLWHPELINDAVIVGALRARFPDAARSGERT